MFPIPLLLQRMLRAFATWPTWRDWCETGLLLVGMAAVALPLGHGTGLLKEGRPPFTWPQTLAFAVAIVVVPCLDEELLFRVFLLPHPREPASLRSRLAWSALALSLYVAWHPLNAWLFLPAARPVFDSPIFLSLTALLGGLCTIAYERSGSIWPPVAIHWAVVVAWKLFWSGV